MADLIGRSLGRYKILEQLGEGGMATVYKAYDTRLERDVAIKIIRRGAFPPDQLNRVLKRFEREAKAQAKLSHPNIIKVIDYGNHDDSPYLVMEYLSGGTLKQRIGKPISWKEAVRILIPIAGALEYAHEHNIIHRDIKPSNILLTEKSQPMLTDFGIAKVLESEETTSLTGTGIGVGTPEYMAPEQWTGKVGPRSDIYSLGVVFYEMVTGHKPYVADTPAGILLKQAADPIPRPKQFTSTLPDKVEKVLIKSLSKKLDDRYQSMADFSTALVSLDNGQDYTSSLQGLRMVPEESQSTIDQLTSSDAAWETIDQDVVLPKPVLRVRKRKLKPASRWRSLLWIVLGWAIGWSIEVAIIVVMRVQFISGVTGGAFGGFASALVLRQQKLLSESRDILWIIFGWVTGAVIGVTISQASYSERDVALAAIILAIAGAFNSAISIGAIIWRLRIES